MWGDVKGAAAVARFPRVCLPEIPLRVKTIDPDNSSNENHRHFVRILLKFFAPVLRGRTQIT